MEIMEVMEVIGSILGMVAAAGVSFGVTYWRTRKTKVQSETEAKAETEVAKAEAAKAEAQLAILAEAKKWITRNELDLKDIHEWLKTRQGTAGGLKFENVLNAVKIFCLAHQYKYDDAQLEQMIKDEVEFTKTVNAK